MKILGYMAECGPPLKKGYLIVYPFSEEKPFTWNNTKS